MDFDEMFETWRAQNTTPPYDVNRDALRQALQAEAASVQEKLRTRRRELRVMWIIGTGLAVWAAFWIAITITNGWSVIYAIASAVSVGMFGFAAWASSVGRGREPERHFGNTLQDEVRRNLALVDHQLSVTRRWIIPMLGTTSLIVGVALFSWTMGSSQDVAHHANHPESSGTGWFWYAVVFGGLGLWASYKARVEKRKAEPKLELRQRRLRELLDALQSRE